MKNMVVRLLSGLLCVTLLLGLLPAIEVTEAEATGYDRGYDGCMAGDGALFAHGLDVSAWQKSGLNFQNFAAAGYDFVILRCGTSYGKDTCFNEYYASAKAAGLDVGCYYYSYATSVSQARQEALDMISWMGDRVFEYPIYFDYEDPSQQNISGAVAAQICYAFMDTLRDHGYLVGMYSMASWLEQSWVTSSGIRDTYEGWIAHLPTMDKNTGITSGLYGVYQSRYSRRYGLYQYSFTTYVNGAGPFDANVAYKDYPAIVKAYGFNGYASEETWVEKAAFDVMVYRDRNPDIAHMTDAQLKEHWLNHGIDEGRASSPVLDLQFYLNNNPDLKTAFGTDYRAAYNHFITIGHQEHRKFSALFDGDYYCKQYPDVAANYKEEYMRHYVEIGMKEGRRASVTFDPDYYWFIRPDVEETWPGDYAMCAKHYAGHGVNAQIQAFDSEHPVVSDVKISDVRADGYTVSCVVTDNWAIRKVAFPTWTLADDQDDLAENFMETQLGTQSGNTYTFRVKASDHNYELGQYITHIYAVDNGGNTVQVVLDVVNLDDAVLDRVVPIQSSFYSDSDGYIGNVKPGTNVSTFRQQFKNQSLVITDARGTTLGETAVISTGHKIKLYSNGTLLDVRTVVVRGDVDGNGLVDSTDYARVRSAFLKTFVLNEVQQKAADADCNGTLNTTDYLQIKAYFMDEIDWFA